MLNEKINLLLSDLVVEYHKLQNFHWYVKGNDFFQVHAKLEELYDGINESIDEVAENLLMIGGQPLGNLKSFLATSKIEEQDAKYVCSKCVFDSVLKDFIYLESSCVEIKKLADEKEEFLISAAMDEQIKYFKKAIWMINQTVKTEC